MHRQAHPQGRGHGLGQTALVVGATRGIGLAIARELAKLNYAVVGWSRSGAPELGTYRLRDDIEFRAVDVRSPSAVAVELEREAGRDRRPDIVIYAAAIVGRGEIGAIATSDWQGVLEVNVVGAFTVLDQFMRIFGRPPSRVIALTSEAASFPAAARSAYSSSKAALNALLESYRQEVRPLATVITTICLGKVNTTLSSRSEEENRKALQPLEVAGLVTDLLGLAPHIEVRSIEVTSVLSRYGY